MTTERYMHGHHESVLRSHRWRTAENSAAYLLAHLRPGLRLLDVGCGPATLTADLAARVAPGPAIALDRTHGIVATAAEQLRATGATNASACVGDAYGLSLPDASIDVVHAHQVLQHLTDPVRALTEWRRVITPTGIVAARDVDYASMCWYPVDPVLDAWLALYRQLARSAGGEPDAARHLLTWARRAGFERVDATASSWCFANPADRAWWGGTWAERVVASEFATRARAEGVGQAELERMSEAWRRWSEADDAWFAMLHGEIICSG